jgi:hypothetical protein
MLPLTQVWPLAAEERNRQKMKKRLWMRTKLADILSGYSRQGATSDRIKLG